MYKKIYKYIENYIPDIQTTNNNNNIWMYWQNKDKNTKRPPYLDLCLQTIKRNSGNFKINILDDESFQNISSIYMPNYVNIQPLGMRADYVRFCLLKEFGGIWLDFDTIVVKNLDIFFNLLKQYEFIGFEHNYIGDISLGVIMSRPNSKICNYMFEIMNTALKENKFNQTWGQFTDNLRFYINKNHNINKNMYRGFNAKKTIYPVDYNESEEYFWGNDEPDFIIDNFYIICLHNQMYDSFIKNLSIDKILNEDFTVSHIFNYVLNSKKQFICRKGRTRCYGVDKTWKENNIRDYIILYNELLKNNIKPFITGGTLLGIGRKYDLLDNDDDLNLDIFKKDYNKIFIDIIKNLGYSIKYLETSKGGIQLTINKGNTKDNNDIEIDISIFEEIKDKYVSYSKFTSKGETLVFDKFKLKQIKIFNNLFYVPDNIDKFLTNLYGKDWIIPDPFFDYLNDSPAIQKGKNF
tara:strand:+ start:108 stop:1499 length:1392 start_codon:yes stop_codon:yes gene_type:complete